MIHTAVIGIGILVMVVTVAGFFVSFWRQEPPKADNSSRSDWATLAGGNHQSDHHSGSDHGGAP
jgi:hypothetical protein